MSGKKECSMVGCERESLPRSEYCGACKAFLKRWGRRGIGRLMERQSILNFWNGRVSSLIRKKGK